MPRGKTRQDTDMLAMALVGYEQQKAKIDEKIREIKGLLGGGKKTAASQSGEATSAPAAPARKKRVLSAEARKRIASAQKRRWAEHRKKLAQGT
ncbi:MAG: hypothetical protein JWO80_3533 [Bryobacterales bacterium]|nr:hypothetical protein [Bryobacterales bacterium]